MTYKEFSRLIKYKRQQLNITQKEMANRLFVSSSKYNKIENGLREPNFELLLKIIKILNISIDECIKNEKPKSFLYFD